MSLNFMLIDDSSLELFSSQKIIEKEVLDSEIITFIRAKMGVAYLESLCALDAADEDFIPDIILVDLHMPEMDGLEFLEAVQNLNGRFLQNTRIYVLSSSLNIGEITEVKNHSMCDGFMSKPLTTDKIQQLLTRQLIPVHKTN